MPLWTTNYGSGKWHHNFSCCLKVLSLNIKPKNLGYIWFFLGFARLLMHNCQYFFVMPDLVLRTLFYLLSNEEYRARIFMVIVLWVLYNIFILPMIYTISMFYQWFTSTHSWNFAFKAQITALQQAIKAKTSNSKRTELQADFHLFLESALGFYMQVNHVMVDKNIADLVPVMKCVFIRLISESVYKNIRRTWLEIYMHTNYGWGRGGDLLFWDFHWWIKHVTGAQRT